MRYLESTPTHPLLHECVAFFWAITAPGPVSGGGEIMVADLPDGHTEYVFNASTPFFRQVVARPGVGCIHRSSLLYAQKSATSVIAITGPVDLFCIRFKPYGIYRLSGQSLHELTESAVEPHLVFGAWAGELEERILDADTFQARVRIAQAVLARMLRNAPPIDPLVLSALRIIGDTNGQARVHEIASLSNRSRRSLEMKFRDQIGLGMKELARICRFNRFWELRRRDPDAAMLHHAMSCGFYDQSHFIREFRRFTGRTPASFIRSEFDLVKHSSPWTRLSGAP